MVELHDGIMVGKKMKKKAEKKNRTERNFVLKNYLEQQQWDEGEAKA